MIGGRTPHSAPMRVRLSPWAREVIRRVSEPGERPASASHLAVPRQVLDSGVVSVSAPVTPRSALRRVNQKIDDWEPQFAAGLERVLSDERFDERPLFMRTPSAVNLLGSSSPSSSSSLRKAAAARPLTRRQLFTLPGVLFGVEFGYAMHQSFVYPLFLTLGVSASFASMMWVFGPLLELGLQPTIAWWSDRCSSRWGRRRPFILAFCVLMVTGSLLLANAVPIGGMLGDTDTSRPSAIAIAFCGFFLADLSLDSVQLPVRALLNDSAPPSQVAVSNGIAGALAGGGSLAGYLLGGLNLVVLIPMFVSHMQASFTLSALIFFACGLVTLTSVSERPLLRKDKSRSAMRRRLRMPSLQQVKQVYLAMPPGLKRLCLVHWLGFSGCMTFLFFGTDWLASEVYNGDPVAVPGSEARQQYDEGVRVGSIALAGFAAVSLIYSSLLPFLLMRFGTQRMFPIGVLAPAAMAFAGLWVSSISAGVVVMVSMGVAYATMLVIPYTILARLADEYYAVAVRRASGQLQDAQHHKPQVVLMDVPLDDPLPHPPTPAPAALDITIDSVTPRSHRPAAGPPVSACDHADPSDVTADVSDVTADVSDVTADVSDVTADVVDSVPAITVADEDGEDAAGFEPEADDDGDDGGKDNSNDADDSGDDDDDDDDKDDEDDVEDDVDDDDLSKADEPGDDVIAAAAAASIARRLAEASTGGLEGAAPLGLAGLAGAHAPARGAEGQRDMAGESDGDYEDDNVVVMDSLSDLELGASPPVSPPPDSSNKLINSGLFLGSLNLMMSAGQLLAGTSTAVLIAVFRSSKVALALSSVFLLSSGLLGLSLHPPSNSMAESDDAPPIFVTPHQTPHHKPAVSA